MKLTILGTGCAMVSNCYNTCFALTNENGTFLVDGGGGNTILTQLDASGVDWRDIRDIFVTHKHIDHVLGIIWMVRMICEHMVDGDYVGEARLYAHRELLEMLRGMVNTLLVGKQTAFIDKRLHFIPLEDGDEAEILGNRVQFFDIHSTKAKQYGFTMHLNDGRKLTCCGDEPFNEVNRAYAEGSDWLLHEAFCLYAERDIFLPYEKCHSTALDAAKLAQELGVKNLLLYHTKDNDFDTRKERYTAEAKTAFAGHVYVPYDLEQIEL